MHGGCHKAIFVSQKVGSGRYIHHEHAMLAILKGRTIGGRG